MLYIYKRSNILLVALMSLQLLNARLFVFSHLKVQTKVCTSSYIVHFVGFTLQSCKRTEELLPCDWSKSPNARTRGPVI